MSALAKPVNERSRDAELAALDKPERERAQRWVEGKATELPRAIWEANANHARAVFDRQAAEEEARDAEHSWRQVPFTEATAKAKEEARAVLDGARLKLRTLMYVEHLALGTLEAVRARIELTGGRR